MSEPIQFDFAAANDAKSETPLNTGNRISNEGFQFLADAIKKQLAQYAMDGNHGDIHAAIILTHATTGDEAPGMIAVQNAVFDIFSREELLGTQAGNTLGGSTVNLALQWAGSFLNPPPDEVLEAEALQDDGR